MVRVYYLFLGVCFFTEIFFPKTIAAERLVDDTYDHIDSVITSNIRFSYEFKGSNFRENITDYIRIDVLSDGGTPQHLHTILPNLNTEEEIEVDGIFRSKKGFSQKSTKRYLEFLATIDGNTSPVVLYDRESQEPDFSTTARLLIALKGQHLEQAARPLESFRFIIGKIYPDSVDSPMYVSVVCKHGAKGESKKAVSSPAIVRRKISMINPNSNA